MKALSFLLSIVVAHVKQVSAEEGGYITTIDTQSQDLTSAQWPVKMSIQIHSDLVAMFAAKGGGMLRAVSFLYNISLSHTDKQV